ncbi:MAG: glutathione S-transferase family protein [Geminicoccaceae bacterium]
MRLTLVMGSRNISSWSFRPWLALRQSGLAFGETVITLRRPDTVERIARVSPTGKVPVLLVDDRPIWDSLAICELVAELQPELWPEDRVVRAHARAVSAEMHSGFADLRTFMPMDFTARFGPPGKLLSGVARDIGRIEAVWTDCRERYGADGPFLFGRFSVADAMYAPVVSRFVTYAVSLRPEAAAYVTAMQSLPAWQEWAEASAAEVTEREQARPLQQPRPRVEAELASAPPPRTMPAVQTPPPMPTMRPVEPPRAAEPPPVLPTVRPEPEPLAAAAEPPPPQPRPEPVAPVPLDRFVPPPPIAVPPSAPVAPSFRFQGSPGRRPAQGPEIKPIGDGIHRRR